MIVLMLIAGILGWLLGVWLPWWGILSVLAFFVISAYRGAFDGGLEAIPTTLAAIILCIFMCIIGFAVGDVTWVMLFGLTKTAFTGV